MNQGMRNRGLACTLAVLLALVLAGCGTSPTQEEKPRARTAVDSAAGVSAQNLLAQARRSASPERERLILLAAEKYIDDREFNPARNLLMDMDTGALDDALYLKHTDLLSQVAIAEGSYLFAHGILTASRLEHQWPRIEPAIEARLRGRRAQVLDLLGDATGSIEERIALAALLTDPEDKQDNQDAIWQTLMKLPLSDLQYHSQTANTEVLRGWFSLAQLGKANQSDLELQQAQLDAWRNLWPRHPANQTLPSDLKMLRSLIDNQPRRIALLLPQQGRLAKAGEAVRDGFLATYYRSLAEHNRAPEVREYDSSGDVITAYQQAVAEGADLVIGPLDKEKVNELSLLPALSVPLLSLNYADTQPPEPLQGFYQFGLAPEDEARQVARQAYLEGHRYALVIIPAQEWSERSARAFSDEWLELGGTLVNTSQYVGSGDYYRVIKGAMLIEPSEQRIKEMEQMLGTKLQSQARRRQDIDMIFLVADPLQARQIKPTLAFHFAGDLPVYATSHIYSGAEDPKADRDLNGIRFTAMPWLFDSQSAEKRAIDAHAQSAAIYSRLHALGADAYRLYPRLPQLAQVPTMRLYGATGALRLLPDGRVEREQSWARFRNGNAQLLPMVAMHPPEN